MDHEVPAGCNYIFFACFSIGRFCTFQWFLLSNGLSKMICISPWGYFSGWIEVVATWATLVAIAFCIPLSSLVKPSSLKELKRGLQFCHLVEQNLGSCKIVKYRFLITTLVSICKMSFWFKDCSKSAASRLSHSGILTFSRLVLATLQQ